MDDRDKGSQSPAAEGTDDESVSLEEARTVYLNATDDEILAKMQKEDNSLDHWFLFLEKGILPTNQKLANEIKYGKKYFYLDSCGVLCCYKTNKNQRSVKLSELNSVRIIPKPLQYKLLSVTHQLGHLGGARLYEKLSTKYQWVGMYSDCIKFAKGCVQCQRGKRTYGFLRGNLPLFLPAKDHSKKLQ